MLHVIPKYMKGDVLEVIQTRPLSGYHIVNIQESFVGIENIFPPLINAINCMHVLNRHLSVLLTKIPSLPDADTGNCASVWFNTGRYCAGHLTQDFS